MPTTANRQLAVAAYIRPDGETAYHLTGLTVLRVEGGEISDVTTFSLVLLSAFLLLPTTL